MFPIALLQTQPCLMDFLFPKPSRTPQCRQNGEYSKSIETESFNQVTILPRPPSLSPTCSLKGDTLSDHLSPARGLRPRSGIRQEAATVPKRFESHSFAPNPT